ncbi:MAG: CvpA family protein [Spirochaetales bacterium]|nr:CvpA family protein [Spirochaetales bacterium]
MSLDAGNWNYLDGVFAALVLFMALRGLFRGALAELFSVGGVGAGIAAAVLFSARLGPRVEEALSVQGWGQVIAFFGIFLFVYVVMKILEKALRGIVEKISLENLDKALGFVLGCAEGVILTGAVIVVMRIQPLFDVEGVLGGSLTADFLMPFIVSVVRVAGI